MRLPEGSPLQLSSSLLLPLRLAFSLPLSGLPLGPPPSWVNHVQPSKGERDGLGQAPIEGLPHAAPPTSLCSCVGCVKAGGDFSLVKSPSCMSPGWGEGLLHRPLERGQALPGVGLLSGAGGAGASQVGQPSRPRPPGGPRLPTSQPHGTGRQPPVVQRSSPPLDRHSSSSQGCPLPWVHVRAARNRLLVPSLQWEGW